MAAAQRSPLRRWEAPRQLEKRKKALMLCRLWIDWRGAVEIVS